jgi:predicted nucleic acid-binding protein
MPPATRAFFDTGALFAAIWSEEDGGQTVLQLGEAGAVQIVVSRQVLAELERTLRAKAPHALATLAVLLDQLRVEVAPEPGREVLATCQSLVGHPGDAMILAAAIVSPVDYFITLDRQHFLDNANMRQAVPFVVGTPGDFLAWFRNRLAAMATLPRGL